MRSARFYNHGRLPHLDAPGCLQFVTFRLADSLPRVLDSNSIAKTGKNDSRSFRDLDSRLDGCHGACILADPRLAAIVAEAITFRHGRDYDLQAWVVMPNHVHMLFRQSRELQLGSVIKSLKMYTANHLNRERCLKGTVWQSGYFDRLVRNERQQLAVVNYIHQNPVKARLVLSPESWHSTSYLSEFPLSR